MRTSDRQTIRSDYPGLESTTYVERLVKGVA